MNLFKSIVLVLVCLSPAAYAEPGPTCESDQSLKWQMNELGHLADQLFAGLDDPSRQEEMATVLQNIRKHLAFSISKVPAKVLLSPNLQKDQQILAFQKLISQNISLTIQIEQSLISNPVTEDQKARRRMEIAEAMGQLAKNIGVGHERFRNR